MSERCRCSCDSLEPFTAEDVRTVESYLGMGLSPSDAERLLEGMNIELEHCDVTHGDPLLTAQITLAHLKEDNLYYEKLKQVGL